MIGLVQVLSSLPLIGALVRRYATHYEGADPPNPKRLSEKTNEFFARWSVKFSAEYYEAKDRAANAPPSAPSL
jgi:hypothetical protein